MDAMDAKTAVSIIIPFYNGIDWLEMIFVAFGKQTFKDFEVIVADDGSREDVVARLEELMARQPFPVTHLWQEDCGLSLIHILRAHETPEHLVCRLLLEKKNKYWSQPHTLIKKYRRARSHYTRHY